MKVERIAENPGKLGACWSFSFNWEWKEWVTPGWNWRNFTFWHLGVETSSYKGEGTLEIAFSLLGFNLTAERYYADKRAEALGPIYRIKAAVERGEVVTTTLDELGWRDGEVDHPE